MARPEFLARVLPDPMAISIRRHWQPRAALAIGLACALAAPAARPAQPAMLEAGSEGGYAFTIEAKTVARDGDRVRFRLLAINEAGADHYDSTIELDCTHRTRRQLTAIADDGQGHVKRYGAEMASPHVISQGTRADRELRLACARVGLQAAEPPHLAAPASDMADVGTDAGGAHAIFIASVRRADAAVDYRLQTIAPGQANAVRQHILVDCDRQLRAIVQDDTSTAGTRWPSRHVAPGSREARELATVCALPEGPPARWFAGFVVTADGVVVAPHERTEGCSAIVTGIGPTRRTLELVANEGDMALLRIRGGGPWQVMPAADAPLARWHAPVTMLGVSGIEPQVSAAFAEQAGTDQRDTGWPQVRTLAGHALPEGLVWDADGTVVGIALALGRPVELGRTTVRMLPTSTIRSRLAAHQVVWKTSPAGGRDPGQAMRLALAATLPLLCVATGGAR